jgi:hypothetical protein
MPPSAWSGRETSGRPQMDAVGVEDKPLLSDGQMGSHIPSAEPPSTQPTSSRQHPFYGHEQTSTLCVRFITDLFACPQYPPSSSNSTVRLPHFIVHVLHRTKLHSSVTFAALVLFQRLKAHFPTARESSGHFLFVSAFILASEVICDNTYSNKSWSIIAQGMFQLWEINQMEREMCQYLECRSRPGSPKTQFRRTAGPSPSPYPTLPAPCHRRRSRCRHPLPTLSQPRHIRVHCRRTGSGILRHPNCYSPLQNPSRAYMTPPADTPSPSCTPSMSPASSASLPTPPRIEDYTARIVSASST